MTDHLCIPADELLSEIKDFQSCPDCAGGIGVCVFFDTREWGAVQMHSVPCPVTSTGVTP